MRVPPNYRSPGLERFFAGTIIGMIIGFVFFILLYGIAQDKQLEKIKKQQVEIEDLKKSVKTLTEQGTEENQKLAKQLKIQEISVDIESGRKDLPQLVTYELKKKIAQRLDALRNKNIDSIADAKDLIFSSIEGYNFQVEDNIYNFTIKSLFATSNLEITVKLVDEKPASLGQ